MAGLLSITTTDSSYAVTDRNAEPVGAGVGKNMHKHEARPYAITHCASSHNAF